MSQLDPLSLQVARDFARELRALLGQRLKEVRVFGSRARGKARPQSDLDLFVLVDRHNLPLRLEIAGISDRVMERAEFRRVPSPLVMDEAEFSTSRGRQRRLIRDILEEGVSIDLDG